MLIRMAQMEDLDDITQLEAACFPPLEAAGKASFKSRLEAFSDSFLLAVEDGKIIGFVNGGVTNEKVIADEMYANTALHNPDGDYQAIFGLDVHPDYRRQGIAAKLMEELIELTRSRGKKGLTLTCKDKLIHYYETFGYVNLGLSESKHGGAVWYDMILEF